MLAMTDPSHHLIVYKCRQSSLFFGERLHDAEIKSRDISPSSSKIDAGAGAGNVYPAICQYNQGSLSLQAAVWLEKWLSSMRQRHAKEWHKCWDLICSANGSEALSVPSYRSV